MNVCGRLLVVGAVEHGGAGDEEEPAEVAVVEVVVARLEALAALGQEAVEVVVVEEGDLDLAVRDGLQRGEVVRVRARVVRLQVLQPLQRERPRP